jgi:hypothetical protein
VVVDNFNVFRVAVDPAEADPELIIDADAPLAAPIVLEGFQLVARRNPERIDGPSNFRASLHGEAEVRHALPDREPPARPCA